MRFLMTMLTTLMLALPAVSATELGDDGLHKTAWMRDTFKDLREDLDEATTEGKRLLVIFEQRGCIYCTKMHEEVYPDPRITGLLEDHYFVVQVNLFGDVEVTDFDGETLSEKDMAMKWGIMFTPTMMFFPAEVEEGVTAREAAVVQMPGAFAKGTTGDLLTWVVEEGYLGDENFQKYHARKINERREANK
ncbi:thioredoxin family protein [Aliiroseovarius subalbicans]|uniref:thioredoxin family protein n=1 Tax=Aliiroseovarius subalbicans TaxID=2925840 RepID=UPI001F55E76A|nr:thioredoxin family protein [Aliiroseovarius subalbicans]MCI2398112.1 thioredoxin family protein [Aliiroseovarius subalbicans]